MRVLLDECVPRRLKSLLTLDGHDCKTAHEAGVAGMTNGELLGQVELGFDVLVTVDRKMRYQQNLSGRNVAILILCAPSNAISDLKGLVPSALNALKPYSLVRCWRSDHLSD